MAAVAVTPRGLPFAVPSGAQPLVVSGLAHWKPDSLDALQLAHGAQPHTKEGFDRLDCV